MSKFTQYVMECYKCHPKSQRIINKSTIEFIKKYPNTHAVTWKQLVDIDERFDIFRITPTADGFMIEVYSPNGVNQMSSKINQVESQS